MRTLKLFFLFLTFTHFTLSAEDANTIPVLDMEEYYNKETRREFIQKLSNAFHELGFVAILNTGIDQEILSRAYEEIKNFFYLDREVKMQYDGKATNYQRGYTPRSKECAKNYKVGDFKEFYMIGRDFSVETEKELNYGRNIWPVEVDFSNSVYRLYEELEDYSIPLLSALAHAIGQEKEFFLEKTSMGDASLRAIYYPAIQNCTEDNAIWAASHTDIDLITILPYATAQGLEVLNKEGNWIRVRVPKDAFIINAGDLLQNITNGYFRSCTHRVIAARDNQADDRFSIVMFFHPRNSDDLSPLPSCLQMTGGIAKYPTATRFELLSERLAEINLASPKMLEDLAASGLVERMLDLGCASPHVIQLLKDRGLASQGVLEE